jgi:hypothetical protein
MKLRDEEYAKIKLLSGKTKMKTVSSYDADINSTAQKWRPGKPFDRETNINTMSSHNHPKEREAKLIYTTSKAQTDYPYWGTSAFADRHTAPNNASRLHARLSTQSEYKGQFRYCIIRAGNRSAGCGDALIVYSKLAACQLVLH